METQKSILVSYAEGRSLIPKDTATQRLIKHLAQQNYNFRLFCGIAGDALSDWIAAEDTYVRIFMRRRISDEFRY